MLVPSTIDVVSEAYHIAANYLRQTGKLSGDVDIHQPLLDSIAEDFRAGKQSKLILANRAIARFDKIGNGLESDLSQCSAVGL